jgi:hypothetical protein
MSQVKDLLAELDAEFGKKPKQKVDLRTQTITQRNSTGTLSDVIAEANSYAQSWSETPGFEAIRRVTYVQHQRCRCCGRTVSYIGNEFTEFHSLRLKATVKAAEPVFHDSLGFELPHIIEEHDMQVEQCFACIQLSRKVEDLVVQVNFDLSPNGYQLHIWDGVNGKH